MPLLSDGVEEEEAGFESVRDVKQAKEAVRRGEGGLNEVEVELEQQPSPPLSACRDERDIEIEATPVPTREAVMFTLRRLDHPCGNVHGVINRAGARRGRKPSTSSKVSSENDDHDADEDVIGAT